MTERMPDDRARTLRIVGAVLAGALGTALIAAGIWMALRPEPPAPRQTEIEPAERTTPETPTAVPVSPSTSGTAEVPIGAATTPSSTTDPGAGAGAPSTPGGIEENPDAPTRVALIAYRLGADLYVAQEDGSSARAVVRSVSGPYALSPDAGTLAVIRSGVLELLDVASGDAEEAGPAAETAVPCWLADSSRVIFRRRATGTSEGFQLFSVERDGGKAVLLAPGSQAAVSPDGRVVVVRGGDEVVLDGSAYVYVSVEGSALAPVQILGGMPTTVATNGERVFVSVASGERGSAVISMLPDGRDSRQVVGAVPGTASAMWAAMRPSPDGTLLALAAQGDDGYSRTFIAPAGGGQLVSLAKRRDSYLHCWSATGDRLFLIEGNAFQGETTSLVSFKPDGSGRTVVVSGAE